MNLSDGSEIYITPPTDTYSVISRIVYTKSGWLALCNLLGYTDIGAVLLWEEMYHLYSNDKDITLENILDFISSEGFSPCMEEFKLHQLTDILSAFGINLQVRGPEIVRGLELMFTMVLRLLLLKYWQYSRNSLDLRDWKQDQEYTVFVRDMPDAQYEKKMTLVKEEWNKSQLRVPDGSLSPKTTLSILPISNENSRGYSLYLPEDENMIQSDSKEYTGFPAVHFNELRFDLIHDHTIEAPARTDVDLEEWHPTEVFHWVQLRVLNATERDLYLMWNKMTGEIECADKSNDDFAARYSVVFPINLNMIIPYTVGLKFEERHWPLIYRRTVAIDAPVIVPTEVHKQFINQQSWFGPMKYLVNEGQFIRRKNTIKDIVNGMKDGGDTKNRRAQQYLMGKYDKCREIWMEAIEQIMKLIMKMDVDEGSIEVKVEESIPQQIVKAVVPSAVEKQVKKVQQRVSRIQLSDEQVQKYQDIVAKRIERATQKQKQKVMVKTRTA
jgi:hypothetical protein